MNNTIQPEPKIATHSTIYAAVQIVSHQLTTARYITFDLSDRAALLRRYRNEFGTRNLVREVCREIEAIR